MASTNKTRNLQLTHFVESDTPSWLTDYNNDMRKIDDAVMDVQDKVDEAINSMVFEPGREVKTAFTHKGKPVYTIMLEMDAKPVKGDHLKAVSVEEWNIEKVLSISSMFACGTTQRPIPFNFMTVPKQEIGIEFLTTDSGRFIRFNFLPDHDWSRFESLPASVTMYYTKK